MTCQSVKHEFHYAFIGNFEEEKVKETASFTLTQPGKVLDLSAMLRSKKYTGRDNKKGAVKAMTILESHGLVKLEKKEMHRGASAVKAHYLSVACDILVPAAGLYCIWLTWWSIACKAIIDLPLYFSIHY